jgi:aldose sugar dehydrogenase
MKTPVVLVTAGLTVAILVVASLLIATGTRGESSLWPPSGNSMERTLPAAGK